jgi:Hydrogenase maturation factor
MTRKIHAMTDITNGGIRGDANEIAKVAGVKLVFYEKKIRDLVNKKVFDMLERHKIDYLGVSLDSLLIICPEDAVSEVEKVLNGKIKIDEIGHVEGGEGSEIVIDGRMEEFVPKFRESPYTPVKKIVGEYSKNSDLMREKVRIAADRAIKKKEKMIGILRSSL